MKKETKKKGKPEKKGKPDFRGLTKKQLFEAFKKNAEEYARYRDEQEQKGKNKKRKS